MSSVEQSSKPSPNNFPDYHFGQSLDEYLAGNPTHVQIITKDEDTVLTLWQSEDETEFMFRMFYKDACNAAIVMDRAEFNRVVSGLQKRLEL